MIAPKKKKEKKHNTSIGYLTLSRNHDKQGETCYQMIKSKSSPYEEKGLSPHLTYCQKANIVLQSLYCFLSCFNIRHSDNSNRKCINQVFDEKEVKAGCSG